MTDERKKHLDRIRALLAKTVDNGCTEDEAIAAAEMATRLMDKYNLSQSEVDSQEPEFVFRDRPAGDEVGIRLWRIAREVAQLTATEYWTDSDTGSLTFFGHDTDVEIADYILTICERSIRSAFDIVKADTALYRSSVRRSRRIAFLDGMVSSLEDKIRKIRWTRRRDEPAGTGLVVARHKTVQNELAKQGISLVTSSARPLRELDPMFMVGQMEGNRVQLEAGVATSTPKNRIESK